MTLIKTIWGLWCASKRPLCVQRTYHTKFMCMVASIWNLDSRHLIRNEITRGLLEPHRGQTDKNQNALRRIFGVPDFSVFFRFKANSDLVQIIWIVKIETLAIVRTNFTMPIACHSLHMELFDFYLHSSMILKHLIIRVDLSPKMEASWGYVEMSSGSETKTSESYSREHRTEDGKVIIEEVPRVESLQKRSTRVSHSFVPFVSSRVTFHTLCTPLTLFHLLPHHPSMLLHPQFRSFGIGVCRVHPDGYSR